MYSAQRKSLLVALIAPLAWAVALPAAVAQESSRGSVAICPVVFRLKSGTKGSRQTAVEAVRGVLQRGGFTLISGNVAANTWQRLRLGTPSTASGARTRTQARLGRALNAKYVLAPVFHFDSRSIWVDLGPKTVSTATVSLTIVNAQTGRNVYSRSNVKGRSDEKFDPIKAGADVLLTPLVTIVSGGPKTPHEQRAVQIAVAKALRDWVK